MLVKERYRNNLRTSRAMPGADANTDHNLVAMKVHLQFKFIRKKKQTLRRWKKETLKASEGELAQKIEDGRPIQVKNEATTEERWKDLKDVIIQETVAIVGHQKGPP